MRVYALSLLALACGGQPDKEEDASNQIVIASTDEESEGLEADTLTVDDGLSFDSVASSGDPWLSAVASLDGLVD